MKPEERIKKRVMAVFDASNLSELARRLGISRSTIEYWKQNPTSIKAVDLERLETLFSGRSHT